MGTTVSTDDNGFGDREREGDDDSCSFDDDDFGEGVIIFEGVRGDN